MLESALLSCIGPCLAASVGVAPSQISTALNSRPDFVWAVGGAHLGMSLAAWKALPRAPGLSARAVPSCSEGTTNADLAGVPRRPESPRRTTIICSYMARYGAMTLTQSVSLTAKYRARDPHFTFTDGRLSAVRFYTSIDAFNALTAKFIKAYGAPSTTIRDKTSFSDGALLPRVQMVWRWEGQSIRLTDPAGQPNQLEVNVSATTKAPVA